MRPGAVFEILARRSGDVNCDVTVARGYNQLKPLSAHFERRTTTSVPLSSTLADDDVATVRTHRILQAPAFRTVGHGGVGVACRSPTPGRLADAARALGADPAEKQRPELLTRWGLYGNVRN